MLSGKKNENKLEDEIRSCRVWVKTATIDELKDASKTADGISKEIIDNEWNRRIEEIEPEPVPQAYEDSSGEWHDSGLDSN